MMKPNTLQKIKEEMQAQEKQDYKNALKNKMKDRQDAINLPKFAKTNKKDVIECQICHFSTKDKSTFMSHIGTKKHQTGVEQQNRLQAKAQAEVYERPTTHGPINAKRSAQQELTMTVQDIKDDEETARKLKNPASALVAYDEDDEEEDAPGPQLPGQESLGPQPDFIEPSVDEKREVIENQNRKEDNEMLIEHSAGLPAGFFDRGSNREEAVVREENPRKIVTGEEEKNIDTFKQFMEEIKKTGGEDHEEILKEIPKDVAEVREDEQEMLEKVIQNDEDAEDAQDYISNLRKRLAMKAKAKANVMNIESTPTETSTKNKKKDNKMEDEDDDDTGSTWKKRGLF